MPRVHLEEVRRNVSTTACYPRASTRTKRAGEGIHTHEASREGRLGEGREKSVKGERALKSFRDASSLVT